MSSDGDISLSYLARKGWHITRSGTGWRVTHPERKGVVGIGFTPSWVCLGTALEDSPVLDEELARALLGLNEAVYMAKFCRDSAGTLSLQVELPAGDNLQRLEAALDAVGRCLPLYATARSGTVTEAADDRTARERYFEQTPGIPNEVLAYYLRAVELRGWWVRGKPKGVAWPLVYKGQRLFSAYLTITRAWACFQVVVLTEAPVLATKAAADARLAFLDYLLRINDAWFWAKVGLDDAGRVLAMVEVPTPELDFETFRKVTALLATYLDLYAREMQIMAHLTADARLAERVVIRP